MSIRTLAGFAHETRVPELRHDVSASGFYFLQHTRPTGEGFRAMEIRNAVVVERNRMIGCRAFGDDQADAAFRAPAVVSGDVLAGHLPRGLRAGHRRHDNAVRQGQAFELERREQRGRRAGHVEPRFGIAVSNFEHASRSRCKEVGMAAPPVPDFGEVRL